jgi:hypothetical protein
MMQAMPDSVIRESNGILRFEGPGRYAKDVNLEGAAMKTMIGTMASQQIYSDPTMVAFESLYVPENGDLSPSYAPFVGTLPPTTERASGAVASRCRRSDSRGLSRELSKMVDLLGRILAASDRRLTDSAESSSHDSKFTCRRASPRRRRWPKAIVPARSWAGSDRVDQGPGRRSGAGRRRSVRIGTCVRRGW